MLDGKVYSLLSEQSALNEEKCKLLPINSYMQVHQAFLDVIILQSCWVKPPPPLQLTHSWHCQPCPGAAHASLGWGTAAEIWWVWGALVGLGGSALTLSPAWPPWQCPRLSQPWQSCPRGRRAEEPGHRGSVPLCTALKRSGIDYNSIFLCNCCN